MSWRIRRRHFVGALIVLQLAALCVIPVWSRGQARGQSTPARASGRADTAGPFDFGGTKQPASPDHVIASEPLNLVRTSYRLSAAPAKALTQFLEEHIGRPEVFEISLQEPDVITIIAPAAAQNTIGELIALLRNAAKEVGPQKPVAGRPFIQGTAR